MSGYSDYYKDQQQAAFIREWGPKEPLPESAVTRENLAFNIARANRAEARLRDIDNAIRIVRKALGL